MPVWIIALAVIGVIATVVVLLGRRRDRTSYEEIQPKNTVCRVVTLIHGTWPRLPFNLLTEIDWYRTKAPLCKALYGDGENTLIHRFEWSGSNTISARLAAGRTLHTELTKLLKKHPTAKHFLIVHSHGASVVFSALCDDPWVAKQISGIVFLSVPFLRVSERSWVGAQLSQEINLLQWFAGIGGALLIGTTLYWLATSDLGFGSTDSWFSRTLPLSVELVVIGIKGLVILSLLLALFVWVFVMSFRPAFITRRLRRLYQRAISYAAAIESPTIERARVLIVRPVADEASAALTIFQVLGSFAGYLDSLSAKVILPLYLLSVVFWLFESRLGIDAGSLLLWSAGIIWVTILASQLLRTFAALPFGVSLSLFTPFLDVSVEAAPPGTWTIRQLPPGIMGGLLHSSTHDDPSVVEEVRQWLTALE